ncbi:alpha/beta fold hydrolase [Runella slithyformis]|uniref:Alpha/beta hydrolase fold protein n=1 Tax=Runella slithyformis (strain ATCC 29530 / DSM 19594 / LMG 11500 / NCIMB 11436 / LSU 4) TaxID=761193 RepID=A0A7U4E6P1_RUNSL|nr:alpha/beta hydrolase [Runella slithyformis]AEI49803.1 alpha/beta hydrolase fold protein [Runella slithyformis DSM 19594]
MKIIERDNAIIQYTRDGNGETTLLFVHGSYIDHTYWMAQIDHFTSHYTVVTFDLPGHGASGKERESWTVEGFALDVITVVKELALQNVILIGHSLAADINLMAATMAPELFIGFIAIDYYKNAGFPLAEEEQVNEIRKNLRLDFAATNEQYARMALLTPQTPPDITDSVVKAYRNAYAPMGIPTMEQIFDIYTVEKKLLPLLNFKLYLINVDYLPTQEEPLKTYAKRGYSLAHMKGTSHFPMIEHPQKLNTLLESFIAEIEGKV